MSKYRVKLTKHEVYSDIEANSFEEAEEIALDYYMNDKMAFLDDKIDEIEVECLPTYIPQTADIDVSDIDFDTAKLVRDADVANMDDVEVLTDLDQVVCTLSMPSIEEEEDEDLDEEISADVPVIGEDEEEE